MTMLSITIICVGKLKEKFLRDASDEYRKRLSSLCKLSIVEIPAKKLSENPSEKEIENALLAEGNKIIGKIPPKAKIYTLCIEGKQYSSVDLSKKIEDESLCGNSHIVFIIGGSFGLSETVKQKSHCRLSMSKMTFPHQLARIMLLEQIYRAMQISAGTKYHK